MEIDPALTPHHVNALNAVDLRLLGVTHGRVGEMRFESIADVDYRIVKDAVDQLSAPRGDMLAIEPTGFMSLDETPAITDIVPFKLPEGVPIDELRGELADLMEDCRATFRINNLAYAAIHALLRDIPVRSVEVTEDEWEELQVQLGASPEGGATRREQELYYRNGKMLSRLGNAAIHMTTQQSFSTHTPPILLYITGKTHTPRLGSRLHASGVRFTDNLY